MNYLLSSSFVFWLTIGLILGENSAYAAPFDPYEFEIQSAPIIYRRSLINNLPMLSPQIVARRSVHPCRWKLCGAYSNYNTLG
ncbi:unnamed protein product [Meloidogyne enterolobii]|uniref:Uncharacterized protein n=1 Tax=Meloidogyne enterolobii TaxID=390850 RepID=A0ACB0ZHK2_MELEN